MLSQRFTVTLAASCALLLGACRNGDGAGDSPPPPRPITIGGSVSGLVGSLVLQNNGGDSLTVTANGAFTFANPAGSGAAYNVTVLTPPDSQTCAVTNGNGTASVSVSNVVVTCAASPPPPAFSVGGSVSGLIGGVVLQLNGGDNITVNASGTFTFPGALASGTSYIVSVLAQPDLQICAATNNSGTAIANVTGVVVDCSDATPPTLSLSPQASDAVHFSWSSVPGSTSYRLMEDPTGDAGFAQLGQQIAASDTAVDRVVAVYRRLNARYMLQACAGSRCIDSNTVDLSGTLTLTIDYLKASNTGASDFLGGAVALSADGSTLAVGAFGEDSDGTHVGLPDNNFSSGSGAVYVFVRVGGTWSQRAFIKASNTGTNDLFGRALALSADGSTLAVAAPGESSSSTGIGGNQNDDSMPNAGAVYVFANSGITWIQQAYIKASNTTAYDLFGFSVALSADGAVLAVGDLNDSGKATDPTDHSLGSTGAAYVFARSGAAWSQQAYIKASNADYLDNFGYSIALSADGATLAVGSVSESSDATGVDGDQNNNRAAASGAVYVFARATSNWNQQSYIKASNTGSDDNFGCSLALSADGATLAVGAYLESSNATGVNGDQSNDLVRNAGAAYVFAHAGNGWTQEAYVKASNTGTSDLFGFSVALSGDGESLAVGAIGEGSNAIGIDGAQTDDLAGRQSGAVYLFGRIGTAWIQDAYVKASNTNAFDAFAKSIALSAEGRTLAVGAFTEGSSDTGVNGNQEDNSAMGAGAVYVY